MVQLTLSARSENKKSPDPKPTRTIKSTWNTYMPTPQEESGLRSQFSKLDQDCHSGVEVLAGHLQGQPTQNDLVVSCREQCGRGGCPFQIYLKSNEKFKKVADFFGHFDVTATTHNGYFDIQVTSSMGSDQPRTFTLRYDGNQYN